MSKEVKIGILTVVAGALLYYGFNFLRGTDLFSPTKRYYVVYPNVAGLNISNPVYFNGLPIGRVSDFKLQQAKSNIIVSLDIDQDVFVGSDATAALANDGLFGGKAIILKLGESKEILEVGDTLKSEIDGGLLDQFEPVADNLNTTIIKVNTLLDNLNSTDLEGTVEELKGAIHDMRGSLKDLEPTLAKTIQEYGQLALSLDKQVNNVEPILKKTSQLMDSLNQVELATTVSNLNKTLEGINGILASIQEGEGSVGKLMKSDSVYNNLNKLLVDLNELAIHFNNYPKDFLKPLGRKSKKLKGISQEEQ